MSISAIAIRNDEPPTNDKEASTMTRYMLSVHSVASDMQEPMPAEEMQHSWQEIQKIEAEMKSSGAWVFSGRLHDPDTARVVRVANGETLTSAAPCVEPTEH